MQLKQRLRLLEKVWLIEYIVSGVVRNSSNKKIRSECRQLKLLVYILVPDFLLFYYECRGFNINRDGAVKFYFVFNNIFSY